MKKRDLYYERIPTKLLREDIRLLGTFLGRVIKDQEGLTFYSIVERLRLLSKNTLLDKNKSKVFSKLSKEVKKFSLKDGSPDGMTLDKDQNLWVAHYHGACISVFNRKAKLIHKITLPAKNITNCTFGGKNNSEIFITSATKGMKSKDLQKYSYSGFLFSIKTNSRGYLPKKFTISNEKKRSLL